MNKFTTRILIVEDDPQIRNFISYVLSAEGFASDNAATAQSAMTLLASGMARTNRPMLPNSSVAAITLA